MIGAIHPDRAPNDSPTTVVGLLVKAEHLPGANNVWRGWVGAGRRIDREGQHRQQADHNAGHNNSFVSQERALALTRAASDEPELGTEFCLWTDHDFMLGTQLSAYAACLLEQGEFARAVALAMESLTLFRTRGNPYESSDRLGILGRLALLQGNLSRAETFLREAITVAAAFSYQEVLCAWQPFLGLATLYGGDAAEAHRLLRESLPLCLELKDKLLVARNFTYLAELAMWEGELPQAERRLFSA